MKIWCDETDCWYNKSCRCKAREAMVHQGECITCRYDKPEKGRVSRDPEDVRRDRAAKRVADKIMEDMLNRMKREVGGK